MFEITIQSVAIYTGFLVLGFYTLFCLYARQLIKPEYKKLIYYVSLFSLFGVFGEHFTNSLYELVFGSPMWEYRVFPLHDGNITYFFISAWGTLGFYSYFRNKLFRSNSNRNAISSGLILGTEAIAIELLVNIPFYLLFDEYIFYYFPENLGPLSHFSCLQIVPFYMIVGFITGKFIQQQEQLNYKGLRVTLALYWMVIISFVFI